MLIVEKNLFVKTFSTINTIATTDLRIWKDLTGPPRFVNDFNRGATRNNGNIALERILSQIRHNVLWNWATLTPVELKTVDQANKKQMNDTMVLLLNMESGGLP